MKKIKSFAAKSFFLSIIMAFALAGKAQLAVPEVHLKNSKTTEAQKEATQRKLQQAIFSDPALCISEGLDLHFFQDFTGKGHSVIEQPLGNGRPILNGVAADNKGNIYEAVTDPVFGPYVKNILTNRGNFTGPLKVPVAITCDKQGRIYIVDQGLGQVIRIDNLGGKNLIAFGSVGSGTGQFKNPRGIAIGNDGKIYISDTDNGRIVRIDDMDGSGWRTYDGDKYGHRGMQVQNVTEIAVDSKNRLYYINNYGTSLMRVDDIEGSNIKSLPNVLITVDSSSQAIYRRIGLAVDRNNKIYVSDAASGNITRFDDMDGNGRTVLNQIVEFFRFPGRIAVYYPVRDIIR